MQVDMVINGERIQRDIPPWQTLLEFIRDDLKLKGTKGYCLSGVCGACTVLLDGKVVSSCNMLAVQVSGKQVTTIEGLAQNGQLHPVQQAFIQHWGFQCGYCTPGMILLAKALLDENPHPTREEIIRYMGGNICRCTGYAGILESVQAVQKLEVKIK